MIIDIDRMLQMDLKDEVFIIETDTVYGIGCLYNSSVGAQRILDIKERSKNKFFSLLISNMDQAKELTIDLDSKKALLDKYWPGDVTFILKKSDKVKDYISKEETVGIRMPNCDKTLSALERFGPMIMTSLNKSGEPPIIKFSDALRFESMVDFIVKGEDKTGIPSTVYDAINDKDLRQGSTRIIK